MTTISLDTIRTVAIIKTVWSLSDVEKRYLNRYFIKQTTVRDFLKQLDASHDYKDIIVNDDIKYEVCYIQCGFNYLEDLTEDSELLLSFRCRYKNNIAFVLVREAKFISGDGSVKKEF